MSRLASIVMTNPAASITLPVYGGSNDDLYILAGADGLGPPEINITLGQSVYRGGVFQGSFPKDREIVFLVNLNPKYKSATTQSIAELRAVFYKLISGPDPITLTVNNAPSPVADYVPSTMKTIGYVRRIEAVPFAKVPQLQITFSCPSPFLESPSFTNIPYTPNTPSSAPFNFEYEGTAEAGFEFNFELTTAPTKVVVKAVANAGVAETISIPGPRVSGELFNVNTNPTARQVYWSNPAISTAYGDITGMCTVTPDRWPSVRPGNNTIQVLDGSNQPLPVITNRLRYITKYWGI